MQKYLLTLLLFTIYEVSSAQSLSYGPRAGIALQQTLKDEVSGNHLHASFNGGGFVRYSFNKWFSLRPELNFSVRKKLYNYSSTSNLLSTLGNTFGLDSSITSGLGGNFNDTVYSYYSGLDKTRFLEVPIMASFNYKNFELGVGPYIAFLLNASSKQRFKQNSAALDLLVPVLDSIDPTFGPLLTEIVLQSYPGYRKELISESSIKSPFAKLDYGIVADLSYHTQQRLFFNFRYVQGFVNYRVTPLKDKDSYAYFVFSVGYSFGAGFQSKLKGIYDLEKIPVGTEK